MTQPDASCPVTGNLPLLSGAETATTSCLPSTTQGQVLFQGFAADVEDPPYIKLLLLLTLGPFLGPEAEQRQGVQAYRVQLNK